MYQIIAKLVQKFSVHPSPSYPIVSILHCYGTFVTTKEVIGTLLLNSIPFIQVSLVFTQFFLFQEDTQVTTLHLVVMSATLSHTFFLFLITLTVLTSTDQIFYKKSLDLSWYDFFFYQTRITGFGEDDYKGDMLFSHHIITKVHTITMTFHCTVSLDHTAQRQCLSDFHMAELFSTLSLSILCGSKLTMRSPHSSDEGR